MELLGIRFSINDIFMYFMSGTICSICIFLVIYFPDFEFAIRFKEWSSLLPESFWWFWLIMFIFVNYTLGLSVSTLSSMLIEKWLMDGIKWLMGKIKHIPIVNKLENDISDVENMVSGDAYKLFTQFFEKEFEFVFDHKKDMRLLITSLESKAINASNTALVFLTIYGICRNICIIFFITGIITFVTSIIQFAYWWFGPIMILLSVFSLQGYIRFNKYYISHLISAYITINRNTEKKEMKSIRDERICLR